MSLIAVYQHCCDFKHDLDTCLVIFYEPLAAHITAGSDKMAQIAASHCLLELFMHLAEQGQGQGQEQEQEDGREFLKFIVPKFMVLFAVGGRGKVENELRVR